MAILKEIKSRGIHVLHYIYLFIIFFEIRKDITLVTLKENRSRTFTNLKVRTKEGKSYLSFHSSFIFISFSLTLLKCEVFI